MDRPYILPWLSYQSRLVVNACPIFIASNSSYGPEEIRLLEEDFCERELRYGSIAQLMSKLGWAQRCELHRSRSRVEFLTGSYYVRRSEYPWREPATIWEYEPDTGLFLLRPRCEPGYGLAREQLWDVMDRADWLEFFAKGRGNA